MFPLVSFGLKSTRVFVEGLLGLLMVRFKNIYHIVGAVWDIGLSRLTTLGYHHNLNINFLTKPLYGPCLETATDAPKVVSSTDMKVEAISSHFSNHPLLPSRRDVPQGESTPRGRGTYITPLVVR